VLSGTNTSNTATTGSAPISVVQVSPTTVAAASTGSTGSTGSNGSSLPHTGVDIVKLVVTGAFLVLLGVLLRIGRRRHAQR
jgi:LPXTG-motif cell wall-anchored protein